MPTVTVKNGQFCGPLRGTEEKRIKHKSVYSVLLLPAVLIGLVRLIVKPIHSSWPNGSANVI